MRQQQLDHNTLIALIERLQSLGVIDESDRDALIGSGQNSVERSREARANFRRSEGPPEWAGPNSNGRGNGPGGN